MQTASGEKVLRSKPASSIYSGGVVWQTRWNDFVQVAMHAKTTRLQITSVKASYEGTRFGETKMMHVCVCVCLSVCDADIHFCVVCSLCRCEG